MKKLVEFRDKTVRKTVMTGQKKSAITSNRKPNCPLLGATLTALAQSFIAELEQSQNWSRPFFTSVLKYKHSDQIVPGT